MLFFGASLIAQTTVISATVIDTDGITWANGSWNITFNPNPAYPNISSYFIGGVPLSPSVMMQSGFLDNSGMFNATIYNSTFVTPGGSGWTLNICPNSTAPCGVYKFSSAGSTMDLSSVLTSIIPPPQFRPLSGAYGYDDIEATIQLLPGSQYWNVNLNEQRCYTGLSWGNCSPSSGSGITQLTGDVTAGPGTGSQVTTLKTVNSSIGACGDSTNVAQITLNAKGLATSCTAVPISFPASTGITQLHSDGTAGPGSGDQAFTLATVNSSSGTCGDSTHVCQVTTNAKGLTTSQSAVSIVGSSIAPNPNTPSFSWTAIGGSGLLDPNSNDGAGQVTITSSNATGGVLFTITYGGTYTHKLFCTITSSIISGSGYAPLELTAASTTSFGVAAPTGVTTPTGWVQYLCHQ